MAKIVIITGLVLSVFILFLGGLLLINPPDNMKNNVLSPNVLGILCILYAIFRIWKSFQMLNKLKNQEEEE